MLYWILGLILVRAFVFKGSHNTEVGTESSKLLKKRSTHFKRYKNIHRTGHGPFPEKFPFSGGSCICINPSSGAQRRMQLMNTSWQEAGWGTEVCLREALGAAKGGKKHRKGGLGRYAKARLQGSSQRATAPSENKRNKLEDKELERHGNSGCCTKACWRPEQDRSF